MLRDRIRVFNKHVTNKILGGFAKIGFASFSYIRHVGRKSGKTYTTVIMAWPLRGGFVIALTYGPNVDWLRNLEAAGGGSVRWHKKWFRLGKPERIDQQAALPAFPLFARALLSRIGAHDFVWLKVVDQAQPAPREAA
jgi:deazaflavin-dependent oxidoreductase (nitroreductase family)